MADVKHCNASPINDLEGFLHIFYCQIKNFTESEKRTNSASTFVKELDNPATEHREASSDYFALVPVNQLDEVVSQSMIP
jgi:hypothetical protein